MKLIILLILLTEVYFIKCNDDSRKCYNANKVAKKCKPDISNIAFQKKFEATNTCGNPPIEYCVHNNINSYGDKHQAKGNHKCYICDANDRQNSHGVEFLTDHDQNARSLTWWQSETMEQGVDYPNSVNLTLDIGKKFEILYVRITFQSLVPESFAIYKRINTNNEWIPYQYYSSSCEKTYNVQTLESIMPENPDAAICTPEFTDIIPLSGGMIAFSPLEERPNGDKYDIDPKLNEWVLATDIRITLNRLNSFGDEFISGDQAKNAYFYAISDIAVGGRCRCNGHAGECISDDNGRYRCICEHNTYGIDCEKCLPFYNDLAWKPATQIEGFECVKCNCNGYSSECYYDEDLFLRTGHGGHCTNCTGNRSGPNCEECNFGFYRTELDENCVNCACDPIGSYSAQCDPSGKCKCKPGVTGEKCDRCAQNYYNLNTNGCQQCSCNQEGSAHSPPICNSIDGTCQCKPNVEGKNCDKCKPGFFSLQESNVYGCFQCFCYGHSSECTTSTNYKLFNIKSSDIKLDSDWKLSNSNLKLVYDDEKNEFRIKNEKNLPLNEIVYLSLPNEYLGNKRLSSNAELTVEIKLENDQETFRNIRIKDLIIENSYENIEVYAQIMPSNNFQKFTFRLNHLSNWNQRLSQDKFHRLLSNITAIKLRLNYNYNIEDTVIKSIILQNAKLIDNFNTDDDQIATHIEQCKNPDGFTGQFSDQCKVGYKRENPSLGLFSRCIPCTCNNHSETCDQITGKCFCMDHTTGDNCEQCESGYHGQALAGTANDCKKCSCPNNGPCAEIYNFNDEKINVVCLNCPIGTQGNLCESCEDGYFLKDASKYECQPCDCNGNIDLNAIGNCDRNTGNCLRCIYNTTGQQCEKCLAGYWGNALTELKCHACECYAPGSIESENINENLDDIQCDLNNGQCNCKPNVIGRQCNECESGFWNITSGSGCVDCKCDMLGAINKSCDRQSGQCFCKPGVTGLKCDTCLPSYYALSDSGCKSCMCDPLGSINANCDQLGRCKCKKNVSGMKCDKCEENKYDFKNGCLECDDCYNLVQRKTKTITNKIGSIETTLSALNKTNSNENNNMIKKLVEKLDELKKLAKILHENTYSNQNLKDTYNQTIKSFEEEINKINFVFLAGVDSILQKFKEKFNIANDIYEKATLIINEANLSLTKIKGELKTESMRLKKLQNDDFYTNALHKDEALTNLAKEARKIFEVKDQIIKDLENAISKGLDGTKKSFEELQNLHNRIQQGLSISEKVDAANLKEKIENLINESGTTKESIDLHIKEVEYLIGKLKEFSISEEYNNNIEKFGKYIENFKQQQISLKNDLENISTEIDKFVDKDSKFAIARSNSKLSDANVKWLALNNYNATLTSEKIKCEARIKKLNDMFANAENILETLQNFDKKISESKRKAEEAEELKESTNESITKSRELVKDLASIHSQSFNELNPTDIVSIMS